MPSNVTDAVIWTSGVFDSCFLPNCVHLKQLHLLTNWAYDLQEPFYMLTRLRSLHLSNIGLHEYHLHMFSNFTMLFQLKFDGAFLLHHETDRKNVWIADTSKLEACGRVLGRALSATSLERLEIQSRRIKVCTIEALLEELQLRWLRIQVEHTEMLPPPAIFQQFLQFASRLRRQTNPPNPKVFFICVGDSVM